MNIKYSKQQFDGFTHRFVVKFKIDINQQNDINVTIYSNCDSYEKLQAFINEIKSSKIISFNIEHSASKEQDEFSAKFIDEMLDVYNS